MAKQDDYTRYTVRVPAPLYERVARSAETNQRSVNAEIVATLEKAYPAPTPDPLAVAFPEYAALLALVQQWTAEGSTAYDEEGKPVLSNHQRVAAAQLFRELVPNREFLTALVEHAKVQQARKRDEC